MNGLNGKHYVLSLRCLMTVGLVFAVCFFLSEPVHGEKKRLLKDKNGFEEDIKFVDINRIECGISNTGFIGGGAGWAPSFFFPSGQRGQSVIFVSGLWMIGKVDGDLREACVYYGLDFQPGMILDDGTPDDPDPDTYKIFKYLKGDAVDAAAVEQGCPSTVLGDQMLFCVYNDMCENRWAFYGLPIGLEVRQTTFAFRKDGALENTVFVRYQVINKGTQALEDAYVAMWMDADLGQSNDDYTGCDSTMGIAYVYNGDNYDDQYGFQVPALACDFVKGPMIDSPGDTARLPCESVIADKKMFKPSAYFPNVGFNIIPGYTDPIKVQEAYSFCSGLSGNGVLWLNPTQGNRETTFPFSGDPISGTGWLMRSLFPPNDIRMGLSSGPFSLLPKDTVDLTIAFIVGQGMDNLRSIEVMKYYDEVVQTFADAGFRELEMPAVNVHEASSDRCIQLLWDSANVSFSKLGYQFEGFNVWQGESEDGPWVRIHTEDRANGVTEISDTPADASAECFWLRPVQYGTDSGLSYGFRVEKDYLLNRPLVKGKTYYFAVTSYAFNPNREPRTMESPKQVVAAVPQDPVLDERYQSGIGDPVPVLKVSESPADGSVNASVLDPSMVTGHSYSVAFEQYDPVRASCTISDVNTGAYLLESEDISPGNRLSWFFDGIEVVVDNPAAGFNRNQGMYKDDGFGYYGFDVEGDPYVTGVGFMKGSSFFGGAEIGSIFVDPGSNAGPFFNCRIDFWNRAHHDLDPSAFPWSECAVYRTGSDTTLAGIGTFPGAAYDIEDPDHPRRVNVCFAESDVPDLFWDPVSADGGKGYGGREFLFVMMSDYTSDPSGFSGQNPFSASSNTELTLWARPADTGVSGDREFSIVFWVNHPFREGDQYTVSTAGLESVRNREEARERLKNIRVFPNPYLGDNRWEKGLLDQFVTFSNLPERCVIRVFTLSGQLVRTIRHDNGTPFERWDLKNEKDLAVSSGMYIVHFETDYGAHILKLGVVNREYPSLKM